MDTTPKYILMCEKAEKIQEQWESQLGDWVTSNYNLALPGPIVSIFKPAIGDIWLPRQDQLQAMVAKYGVFPDGIQRIYSFYTYYDAQDKYSQTFDSMEQLWLAFVMHEKYEKQWSEEKEEWINA